MVLRPEGMVRQKRTCHQDSHLPCWAVAASLAMTLDGLQGDLGTAEICLTDQSELIMHCLQVVDYDLFVLPFLSAPMAKGHTGKVMKCIWVMNACQAHDLG